MSDAISPRGKHPGENVLRGVYSDTTQLNSTQRTQLNSVQPSQSCFCLWRHDLQTESTVVHAVELSSVELSWVVSLQTPLYAQVQTPADFRSRHLHYKIRCRIDQESSSRFLDRPLVTVNFRFSCECKQNRMAVKLLLILLVLLLLLLLLLILLIGLLPF